jgi:hypothetical protein
MNLKLISLHGLEIIQLITSGIILKKRSLNIQSISQEPFKMLWDQIPPFQSSLFREIMTLGLLTFKISLSLTQTGLSTTLKMHGLPQTGSLKRRQTFSLCTDTTQKSCHSIRKAKLLV